MADGGNRVELRNPDGGVIHAAEADVETLLAAGWERVSGTARRRADTGSNPTITDGGRPSRRSGDAH
jgi:hypothetical protein